MTARAWLVRGGEKGEYFAFGFDMNLLVVSFAPVPDLSGTTDYSDVFAIVKEKHPEDPDQSVRNWATSLNYFCNGMNIGELVIVTQGTARSPVAVARVIGDYRYRPDFPDGHRHTRRVEWLVTGASRDAIAPTKSGKTIFDNCRSTVCRITDQNAISSVSAILNTSS